MYIRSHSHGTDTLIGYRVARTLTPDGIYRREIVHTVAGATNYAKAVADKNDRMDHRQGKEWFVIDFIYSCGCVYDPYINDDPIIPIPAQPLFTAEDAAHAYYAYLRTAQQRSGGPGITLWAGQDAARYTELRERATV